MRIFVVRRDYLRGVPATRTDDPAAILARIDSFLASCRQPALLEDGEEPISLEAENHVVECRRGRLTIEAWDSTQNIARRILGVEEQRLGRLSLRIERFGKRQGRITLYDQARPNSSVTTLRGGRLIGRELLRRFLRRQFPGWRVAALSADAHLEHSLSPAYPRALLTRGSTGWAAVAAPPEANNPDGALTYGLIWLDYLRRNQTHLSVEGLAVFLPEGQERTTCLRIRHLNPRAARYEVFAYSKDAYEERIDPRDHGNLETRLETCRTAITERLAGNSMLKAVLRLPAVDAVRAPDGSLSLRVRGLEFARFHEHGLEFGIARKRPAGDGDLREIELIVSELDRSRSPATADRSHPLYSCLPEAWLESRVRADIETVEADLVADPIYGQVPAFAGGERGVIDPLACDHRGRLAVLELKASADPHLPLQALDYWMRVRFHLARGDFGKRGYFPGRELSPKPPRIILLAPALEFHPTTESLLRFVGDEVPVLRIGLGMDWRKRMQVVFRAAGSERPGLGNRISSPH